MNGPDRDPGEDTEARRQAADADPPSQAGVLGNLPKKRPSVRSPRRPEPQRTSSGAQAPPAPTKVEPEPQPTAAAQRPGEPGSEHSHAADLEGLARGGIAIAGGAASLGLKIAGRAAAALRDAVERR